MTDNHQTTKFPLECDRCTLEAYIDALQADRDELQRIIDNINNSNQVYADNENAMRMERDRYHQYMVDGEPALPAVEKERDKWRRLACEMTGDECVDKCNDGSGYHADNCPVINTQARFEELIAERDELRKDVTTLREQLSHIRDDYDATINRCRKYNEERLFSLRDENDELRRQQDELIKALRFYASNNSWADNGGPLAVDDDAGRRAKEVLAEIEKGAP